MLQIPFIEKRRKQKEKYRGRYNISEPKKDVKKEMDEIHGRYTEIDAARDYHRFLMGESIAHTRELSYYDKRQIHNLKYFTWIEQQERELKELNDQWYDHDNYWNSSRKMAPKLDELINEFNDRVGLLK